MKAMNEKKETYEERLNLAVTSDFKDKIKAATLKKYLKGEMEKPDVSVVARMWLEEKLDEFEQAA